MKFRNIIFLLVLTLASAISFAQDEASVAMQKEDYPKAVQLYEAMTTDGQGSYSLFVNLGTAYSKLENFGKARLAFERALKIQPRGSEALNNIAFVKDQLSDEIIEVKPFFMYRWWQALAMVFSSNIWLILNILFLILSLYLLYEYLLGSKKLNKKKVFYGFAISLFFFFLSLGLGSSRKYHLQRSDTAIILNLTELHLGADDKSESVSTLLPGHKIIILDKIGDWYKVSKLDKEQGWIKAESFEII